MVGWVGSASVWLHSEGILNLWEEEFAISCICASVCVCVCVSHTHTHTITHLRNRRKRNLSCNHMHRCCPQTSRL